MSTYRTNTCGELTIKDLDKKVTLAGFVLGIRDHGGVMFIDLRDHYGVTQIVVHDDTMLKGVTKETVIKVTGKVVKRDIDTINKKIPTGEIEVVVEELELLSDTAKTLPFEIDESKKVAEDVRLKYRFLDLRNPKVHEKIVMRSKAFNFLRNKMMELGFLEITTPIITSSSPEGARDFIIPSRKHKGKFYALPQAPQQFKQLLMASGFDKYFQLAPCFRDEDGRKERLVGEFYQLDMEMAFADQEDVMAVAEEVYPAFFREFGKRKVTEGHFKRIPYNESMLKYGTDKPDLRNPLIIQDVTKLFETSEFNAFKNKTVKAIIVPNGAKQGRKFFDKMGEFATTDEVGAKGLAWTKYEESEDVTGGIAKFITDEIKEQLINEFGMTKNSSVFFIADEFKTAQKIAGLVRIELGKRLDLLEKDVYRFCYIVDFPMYELSDEGTIDFNHNPFSMPQGGMEALETKDPLDILAYQYDLVCNGYEMASGAVRNHNPEIMVKAFEIAGYKEEDVKNRFGALYNAFQYGTPPHAGAAPGVDRMVMLIEDSQNIREVIAFPKNKRARDLLMRAPSVVSEQQLKDVHIKLDLDENK